MSSQTFLGSINGEEEEEVVNQLVLNRRQGQAVSLVKPIDPALPISISSSDNEHPDDLAHARPSSVGEAQDVGLSLVGADTIRFRNLKKKSMPATDPAIIVPLVSRVP